MNYIPEKDQEMGQPKHYGNNMKEGKKKKELSCVVKVWNVNNSFESY